MDNIGLLLWDVFFDEDGGKFAACAISGVDVIPGTYFVGEYSETRKEALLSAMELSKSLTGDLGKFLFLALNRALDIENATVKRWLIHSGDDYYCGEEGPVYFQSANEAANKADKLNARDGDDVWKIEEVEI